MMNKKDYYVYILRCRDESLYTGITTDVEKRYREHERGEGAKYTRAKGVKKIELFFKCSGRSEASRIEKFIKNLKKPQKELYIDNSELLFEKIKEKLNLEIKNKKSVDTK